MFQDLKIIPTDPILGLMIAFKNDTNPLKIDLGVGVYKDEQGHTPILDCVKIAEKFRLENEMTKAYMGMAGDVVFNERIVQLLFGTDHEVLENNRMSSVQTPGGTGALRVAADFIKKANPSACVWVSAPTWANHLDICDASGLLTKTYNYYDYEQHDLQFEAMLTSLEQAKKNDVVLLHACCHNPSGMDLNQQQWQNLADFLQERGLIPLVDIAYQGFGEGLDEDAYGLRLLAETQNEMIVCSSCSKNFGLYRERVGACIIISQTSHIARVATSAVQGVVRGIYSMPPAHGAAIVNTILSSSELTQQWQQELTVMRDRINQLRVLTTQMLAKAGAEQDFDFIQRQSGMFSFLGIDEGQVSRLREEFGIYMTSSSRMNIAGINDSNCEYFAQSVVTVLQK